MSISFRFERMRVWSRRMGTVSAALLLGLMICGGGTAARAAGGTPPVAKRWVWCNITDTSAKVRYNSVVFQADLSPFNYADTASEPKLAALQNSFVAYVSAHRSLPSNTSAACYYGKYGQTQATVKAVMTSSNKLIDDVEVNTGWPPGTLTTAQAVKHWIYMYGYDGDSSTAYFSAIFQYDVGNDYNNSNQAKVSLLQSAFKNYIAANYKINPNNFGVYMSSAKGADTDSAANGQSRQQADMQQYRNTGSTANSTSWTPQ